MSFRFLEHYVIQYVIVHESCVSWSPCYLPFVHSLRTDGYPGGSLLSGHVVSLHYRLGFPIQISLNPTTQRMVTLNSGLFHLKVN